MKAAASGSRLSAETTANAANRPGTSKVPEPKRTKYRVHLDMVDSDSSAVDKFVAAGATVVGQHEIEGHRWTVMQDPDGNEFCIAGKSFTG